MKSKLFAALLISLGASLTAPAFASADDPAPIHPQSISAAASQREPGNETPATERGDAAVTEQSYGGMPAASSQSAGRPAVTLPGGLYAHH
jgi:hypothetical protein